MSSAQSSHRIGPKFDYQARHQQHYEELGYCIFEHFLTPQAVADGRANIDRMIGQLQKGRLSDEIISAHHEERWIFDLACEPKILDMIERQIGPDIALWSTALVCKPPMTGRYVPWHQDAPYWNIEGKLAAGVWIPFDDVDHENGAMAILPRWHNRGVLPRKKTDDNLFTEEIDPAALPPDLEQIKVEYLLRAGQAAIHDTMIPHNSVPNRSSRWRRVLVLRYASADSKFPSKNYPNYRTGEPFAREAFLLRGKDSRGRGLRPSPFE